MSVTISPAVQRVLPLLTDPPTAPTTPHGYLDQLGPQPAADGRAVNTGFVQSLWSSRIGASLFDHAATAARRVVGILQSPAERLRLQPGHTVLDIACGPGEITTALARTVGPGGLAVGIDISESMLTRAAHRHRAGNTAFLRADAQRLPLRDHTVDAVTCIAGLQLIPDPDAALAEMIRVLRPGGYLAVLVPTVRTGPLELIGRYVPGAGGARLFTETEIPDSVVGFGLGGVDTRRLGTIQWTWGRKIR
ncbi:methyltransferase domain-containing protein [Nocardia iowensis]|uniref:Methyltransferase domain-containing protein n=1 Tax=Nocardia iowensis TaxID=204891 RepID=A0ABX8RTW2_NOCIO|nr:methyltransferase domain-containing protein [Nocardia iowensis]QXN93083.1 methyltransferase domain-containing protein [Nocardia iowensis]